MRTDLSSHLKENQEEKEKDKEEATEASVKLSISPARKKEPIDDKLAGHLRSEALSVLNH